MKIWKYTVMVASRQQMQMPSGAKILSVQNQDGQLCIWALVDPNARPELRTFLIAGTGHDFEPGDAIYIGTVQMSGGTLVWHLFEIPRATK